MYSKKVSVANGDLVANKKLESIIISDTTTSVSGETNTIIKYPKSMVFFNDSGRDVDLVFLSSGELAEFTASVDDFGGIRVLNADKLHLNPVPDSQYVHVETDGAITSDIVLSFFHYQGK